MKKKKRTFKIGITKLQQDGIGIAPLALMAQQAKKAMDYLAPLIRSEHMPPVEALVLSACTMHYNITGSDTLTEEEIQKNCHIILSTWKNGLFRPNAQYPHSLATTLSWDEVPNAQDGSEDGNE